MKGSSAEALAPRGGDLFVRGALSYPPGPDARPLDVRIGGGRVAALGPDLEPGGLPVLEAGGLTVIPGLVDVHVHFRDPGLARKEGWETGSAGALFGGVTAVVEVQNNPPLSVSRAALEDRIAHVRARSRVDFGCLANLLPDSVAELDGMAPLAPALKLFLGGSTGLGGQTDEGTLRSLFAAAARVGRMVVAHCEDEELLRQGKRERPDATAAEHHLVRSTEAEVRSIDTAIRLCEETGAELHVFHISTAEGVELVRSARARGGARIGASTAPHYLLLSCEDAPRLGNRMKVNPSIKTPADAAGILRGLADGTVDAIGTDHAPHPVEEKDREYKHAPSGMPSVDLLWPLTFELVRRGLLDAETALASVTLRAAQSLHLPNKGALAPGVRRRPRALRPRGDACGGRRRAPVEVEVVRLRGLGARRFPRGWSSGAGVVAFADGAVRGEAGGEPLQLEPPHPAAT